MKSCKHNIIYIFFGLQQISTRYDEVKQALKSCSLKIKQHVKFCGTQKVPVN